MLQVTVTEEGKVRTYTLEIHTLLVGRSNKRLSDTQCEWEGSRVRTWESKSVGLSSLAARGQSLTQTQEGWRRNRRVGSCLLGEEQGVQEVWPYQLQEGPG